MHLIYIYCIKRPLGFGHGTTNNLLPPPPPLQSSITQSPQRIDTDIKTTYKHKNYTMELTAKRGSFTGERGGGGGRAKTP